VYSQLSLAVAQSRQQDMLRRVAAAQVAVEGRTHSRRSRIRLTLPRFRPASTTVVNPGRT